VVGVQVVRDWIEWVLIGFTVIGVVLAVYQSWHSGRVATAAKRAVERAENRLGGNQFLLTAARLEAMEAELTTAAANDDREKTAALLVRWRQVANELLGLADGVGGADETLIKALEDVAEAATEAQMALEDTRKGPRVQTKRVRAEIASALGLLSRHAGQLKASSGEELR
jgi:hypothetical protein